MPQSNEEINEWCMLSYQRGAYPMQYLPVMESLMNNSQAPFSTCTKW